MPTANDIIAGALLEINAISPGEPIDSSLANWGLIKLNRMIDAWDAQRLMVYAKMFPQFTLVPNLQPHTIGVSTNLPSPTWAVSGNRPVKILAANLIINQAPAGAQSSNPITAISKGSSTVTITALNNFTVGETVTLSGLTLNPALNNYVALLTFTSGTEVQFTYSGAVTNGTETGLMTLSAPSSSATYNIPINIRDADWWAAQRVQTLTTTYPTDLYYEPDWPNGSLYFWPVPTTAYPVQLEIWTTLSQFTALETFSLPPAYWDAVVWSLAETLLPSTAANLTPSAQQQIIMFAAKARDAIKVLNEQAPRISTGGDGLPTGTNKPSFDWRTGFSIGTWSR